MKRYILAFILILICTIPLSALAAGDFSYSFENPEDAVVWSGGVFDDSNAFDNGYSLFVSNPFGEIINGRAAHVLDYGPKVALEAGKVYTLSGYVMNPLETHSPSVRASASRGAGANTVLVTISGIGDEWAEFSTTFYVGQSGEYNLSLHFAGGYADFGLFVDELKLTQIPCILSSLNISGQEEILIPATDSVTYYYRPFITTSDGKTVDIISSESVYFEINNQPGISFNSREFSLTVTADATPDSTVKIGCTLQNFVNLPPTSISVFLTDNMIDNSGFTEDKLLWSSSSSIELHSDETNKYISVPTNDYGEYGYFGTVKYENPQILLKDVLYVIRARVKSDIAKPFSAIYAKNSAECRDNTIYFSINEISGYEWIDVFAAFIPEQSGIYDIALNLCSAYDCTVYVDDISLSCESLAPEYITVHAPGNIAIPNVSTQFPVSALLRDQLGNIIESEDIELSLLQNTDKIQFDPQAKLLTVYPDTPAGVYTLTASYIHDSAINAQLNITVSFDYIGDGAFENTVPNEWWMVSSPYECDFYMRHDGHSRRALINCKGNYFMLLNNSYVHLLHNMPYVFNSNFSVPVDCTATLFIETLDKQLIPLAQFVIESGSTLNEKRLPELFLSEEDCVGRLFLYVESDNGQPFTLYADNLSLKSASIVAVNPRVTGIPYVNGAVDAHFTLFNNIAESTDTSACVVSWYVSDTINGTYREIPSAGKSIYFDTTYLNKYVYFDVIPVCPITGFSGIKVRSMPFMVTYDLSAESSSIPMYTPVIKTPDNSENYFSDIDDHWGKEYINSLAYSGIANGKYENMFVPEDFVTRAEFSKMLSTSFTINTVADLPSFNDVLRTDWHYPYVTALYLAGIVNGTSEDTFSPDGFLSREEAVVMLMRVYERATNSTAKLSDDKFKDEAEISSWAKDSAKKAVFLGITQGNPDGTFAPKKSLTRAEATALICRLAEILAK